MVMRTSVQDVLIVEDGLSSAVGGAAVRAAGAKRKRRASGGGGTDLRSKLEGPPALYSRVAGRHARKIRDEPVPDKSDPMWIELSANLFPTDFPMLWVVDPVTDSYVQAFTAKGFRCVSKRALNARQHFFPTKFRGILNWLIRAEGFVTRENM